ncbi:unnamed protein product, partial [Ixodes hexagonus]
VELPELCRGPGRKARGTRGSTGCRLRHVQLQRLSQHCADGLLRCELQVYPGGRRAAWAVQRWRRVPQLRDGRADPVGHSRPASASALARHKDEAAICVCGGRGVPLLTNLMRPFPCKSLKLPQKVSNYRLSRARRVIENTFGILVTRWRIFIQPIQAFAKTLEAVVWACVSLHNYLRASDESERGERLYCPAGYADADKEGHPGQTTNGRWRVDSADGTALSDVGRVGSNTHATAVKNVREKYMKYFCSRNGELPWQ